MRDATILVGYALLVGGVGLWSVPAGLAVAGGILLLAGVAHRAAARGRG